MKIIKCSKCGKPVEVIDECKNAICDLCCALTITEEERKKIEKTEKEFLKSKLKRDGFFVKDEEKIKKNKKKLDKIFSNTDYDNVSNEILNLKNDLISATTNKNGSRKINKIKKLISEKRKLQNEILKNLEN